MNYVTGEEAVKLIKPGQRVFVHGGAATPHFLLQKLAERSAELWNVEIISISLQGDPVIADKKYKDSIPEYPRSSE
jgi:acyl-CoA hydrolase